MGIWGAQAASLLASAACRRTLFGKAAEKHRLATCAPQRQNELATASPSKRGHEMSMRMRPQRETNGFSALQALPHSALRSQSSASRFRR